MKIKLTLKTPLKTPYKGNKVTTIETLFTKKKRDLRGISLKFWGFKKRFLAFLGFLNYNHANANSNF
ncbi:hypothetical protein Hpkin61_13830 [Helicobacter pylori]